MYLAQGEGALEKDLKEMLAAYEEAIQEWAVFAISDCAGNGLSTLRWEQLINLIEETYTKTQNVLKD